MSFFKENKISGITIWEIPPRGSSLNSPELEMSNSLCGIFWNIWGKGLLLSELCLYSPGDNPPRAQLKSKLNSTLMQSFPVA